MIERLARRRRRLGHHVVVLSLLRVLEDRWRSGGVDGDGLYFAFLDVEARVE